ncbi:NAD(P)-binding protein [Athelia psychrophila]|uniref:NAD(P)-binding protein n=1 Tax=Athelia psychrophila TaxID=1759441 RepID=A0A166VDT6_9AGAM|nr:NAD(P)-binding protein [Fibularhizoctonia sp. CBS 109695]
MPYKNIAVIGSGLIGGPISKALLAEGANVTVISRTGSTSVKDLPAAIKVVSVSLTDVPALAATFKEHSIEVVVSTVAHAALPQQHMLGDAAKQAGVKLFIPSEFGFSTLGLTEGELGLKAKFAEYLEEIGLPFTRIFTGGFITFIPWNLDISSGKVRIFGKGDEKASFTDTDDIAGFVGYVLTHLASAELENKILRIQGEAASFLDIAAYYPTLPVEHIEEPFSGPDGEFKSFIQNLINSGQGSVGYSAAAGKKLTGADATGASNALWPGHKWRGIKEGLEKISSKVPVVYM